jgi:Flagellar hook capping protein
MIEQILQQQGGFYGADTTAKNDVLGKDAFLKLLVTQLQNQDPLNPLDDKEFIAQLAQFSSLEQMTNISSGITSLTEKTGQQDMLSAVNYIGKEVTAEGSEMTKGENYVTPVYFTLSGAASQVYANVYDANNNLVRTEKFTSMQAGEFAFTGMARTTMEKRSTMGSTMCTSRRKVRPGRLCSWIRKSAGRSRPWSRVTGKPSSA